MWLFRVKLYSVKSTNFRTFINFYQWQTFFAGRGLETLDLPNKLRILPLVADFPNHIKCFFSWQTLSVYGFSLATRGSSKKIWPSVTVARCVTRGGDRRRAPLKFLTANIETWRKNCYGRIQPVNHSTKMWIVGIFAEVSAIDLTAEWAPWFVAARRSTTL